MKLFLTILASIIVTNSQARQRDNGIYPVNIKSSVDLPASAIIGYIKFETYGNLGRDIYVNTGYEGEWHFKTRLPFEITAGQLKMVTDDSVLFVGNNDTLAYYNISGNTTTYISKNDLFTEFCQAPIAKVIFEQGSAGCYYYNNYQLVYNRNFDGNYALDKSIHPGTNNIYRLAGYTEIIGCQPVRDLVMHLPALLNGLASLDDVGVIHRNAVNNKREMPAFKNVFQQEKYHYTWPAYPSINKKDIDPARFFNIYDSVSFIYRATLGKSPGNPNKVISTNSDWIGIKLVNEAGRVLHIFTSYYNGNNISLIWTIELNGYVMQKNNTLITEFIHSTYPAFF